jgi:putative PIN family toxin of toxin-antitoxin system
VRVVLDTNVIVSGAFFGGQPRAVLDVWAEGKLEVVMTPAILEEYSRVCDRLQASYPAPDYRPLLFRLVAHGTLVPDSDGREGVTADPDDDKFMWCALQSDSTVVSGDRHLLDANGWNGVRVLTPSELLASLPS